MHSHMSFIFSNKKHQTNLFFVLDLMIVRFFLSSFSLLARNSFFLSRCVCFSSILFLGSHPSVFSRFFFSSCFCLLNPAVCLFSFCFTYNRCRSMSKLVASIKNQKTTLLCSSYLDDCGDGLLFICFSLCFCIVMLNIR